MGVRQLLPSLNLLFRASGRRASRAIYECGSYQRNNGTCHSIRTANVRCLDPGLEDGGVGGVVYRIRMEKVDS